MAVGSPKYRYTYASDDGRQYRNTLRFAGYGGSIIAVEGSGVNHTGLPWSPGAAEDEHYPFRVSDCTWSLHDAGGVISEDLFAAADNSVHLEKEVDTGSGFTRSWIGPVSPGRGERTLDAFGGVTTVKAMDGLGLLQNIPASDLLSFSIASPTETVTRAIISLLLGTGLDLPVRIACGWYHAGGLSSITTSEDPLNFTLFKPRAFLVEGATAPITAYDLLKALLYEFGLRVYQRDGRWNVIQREYLESTYTAFDYVYNYPTTGTAAAVSTVNPLVSLPPNASLFIYGGGTEMRRRNVREARVLYHHDPLAASEVMQNGDFPGPYTAGLAAGWTKTGTITVAEKATERQFINSNANTQTPPTNTALAVAHVGGLIFEDTLTVFGGVDYLTITIDCYSDSALGSYHHVFFRFHTANFYLDTTDGTWKAGTGPLMGQRTDTIPIVINSTEPVPESGALMVEIYTPVEAAAGAVTSANGVTFNSVSVQRQAGIVADKTLLSATSGADGGETYEAPETVLGDGPTLDSIGALLADDLSLAVDWRRRAAPLAAGVQLHRLRLESIVNGRRAARRARDLTFVLDSVSLPVLGMGDAIEQDGFRFVVERVHEWAVMTGTVAVEAQQLTRSTDAVTYTVTSGD